MSMRTRFPVDVGGGVLVQLNQNFYCVGQRMGLLCSTIEQLNCLLDLCQPFKSRGILVCGVVPITGSVTYGTLSVLGPT